ncbi:MAG: HD domain-containing phosphohydrolase [Candidatus Hydrogenedentales bacterium]|jgi:response regulator RpfG family c-di-GMP phosphodiesterase
MLPAKAKILFVDDDANILEMMARIIRQSGENWEGEFRASVDEALDVLARVDFDTVVSDMRMPAKDGFALVESMKGDARLSRVPVIILTGDHDSTLKRRALDMGVTDLLSKPILREDLIARLRSALRLKEQQDKLEDQVELLDGIVRERTCQLERSHREVVWRLAKAGEFRDDQTGNHVARVAWCSCVLAEALGLKTSHVELLYQTAPLHDIGKIGIPDCILLKPGILTAEERRIMERHPLIGEEILRSVPLAMMQSMDDYGKMEAPLDTNTLSPVLEMARIVAIGHHEKWDGSGYPSGSSGEGIPIEARIVALADVYDALVSERPYKRAMTETEASDLVQRESNRHFDPGVVAAFLASFEKFRQAQVRFRELPLPLRDEE